MQIEWTDDNSVGVEEIDSQHKRLVGITNKLFQAILDDRGFDVLLEVLHELEEYVGYHFRYEEQLLIDHDFPAVELKEHMDEHGALEKQVKDFIQDFSESEATMDIEVFDFLRNWLDAHLGQTDARYVDFFKHRSIA